MAAVFPSRLARRASEAWWIENASRRGGSSFTGQEQFVVSPAARWRGRISLKLLDDADYLEAGGFLASLDGPATPFLIGPVDWRGRPWNIDPLTGGAITPVLARRSASVDPAFDANADTTGRLQFSLAAAAAMNATALVIQRDKGGFLRRGQHLSIGQRLHIITAVTSADPVDAATGQAAPGRIDVAIRPWLRQNHPAGTPVEFAEPIGLMRLTPETVGMIERSPSPLADLTLDLVEAP